MHELNGVFEIKNNMVIRGKTIKLLRIIKDVTLRGMAKETGISVSTLSAMENETRTVTSVFQLKVSRYLLDELAYTPEEVIVLQAFINQKEGFNIGK